MASALGLGQSAFGSRGPPDSIADAAYVNAFLAKHMLDADELGSLLLRSFPDELTCAWFEERCKRHIHATEQDCLFAMMKRLSQCDECGKIQVDDPMLTCGACRGVHFCNKTCQKENWPKHKSSCRAGDVSKTSYRVADICSKMMTAMSMVEDCTNINTLQTNAAGNPLLSCFHQSGNSEFVYCAVYEEGRVIFIPMPESILQLVKSQDDTVDAQNLHSSKAHIDSMLAEKEVIVLIVAIGTTYSNGEPKCLFLTKKTWVTTTGRPEID